MRQDRRDREFEEFFLARGPALRRTAYVVVRDWHLAEDLTQQALVKVYVAWARVDPERRDAYARKAVVNTCLTWLRRSRPERLTATPPDSAHRDDGSPLDVGAALALLPDRQRAIVALRYLDDISVADVAAAL